MDTTGPVDTDNGWCGAVNREQHPHDVTVRRHNENAKKNSGLYQDGAAPFGVDGSGTSPKKQLAGGNKKSLADHFS